MNVPTSRRTLGWFDRYLKQNSSGWHVACYFSVMNATPAISQTPIATDPAQMGSAASAISVKSDNNGHDFAGVLNNAEAKPSRKTAGHKPAENAASGGQLPGIGNPVPPSPTPAVALGTAASPSRTVAGGAAALGAVPGADELAAGAAGMNGKGVALGATAGTQGKANPVAAFAQALALPVANATDAAKTSSPAEAQTSGAAAAHTSTTLANAPTVTDKGGGATVAASVAGPKGSDAGKGIAAAQVAGASKAISSAAGRATDRASTDKLSSNTPLTDAHAAGSTTSSASNSDPTTQTAATAAPASTPVTGSGMGAVTDAATAATAATASEVSRAGADSALSEADVLATSATASKAPDAGGPNAPSAPTVATVASHQAAAAATSAQAVSTLVNASAADKHSRSATGDSSLSGASGDGAAGLAQVSSSAITATDAAPTLALKVTAGVDTPEFAQGLANRVSWMVDNNLNGAKLQVNPPQLGPIEVRIAVLGGHAQVWMTSHSAVTRDALESSTPKLREMLGAQGFGQVSVDISQRSFQERSSQAQTYDWTPSADRAAYSASVSTTASSIPRTSSGVLDAYA